MGSNATSIRRPCSNGIHPTDLGADRARNPGGSGAVGPPGPPDLRLEKPELQNTLTQRSRPARPPNRIVFASDRPFHSGSCVAPSRPAKMHRTGRAAKYIPLIAWNLRFGKLRRLSLTTRTLSLHPDVRRSDHPGPLVCSNGDERLGSAATIHPLFALPSVAENRYHCRSAFQKIPGREPR
jgi:hypothetical protein